MQVLIFPASLQTIYLHSRSMKATPFQVVFAENWMAKVWKVGFVAATISASIIHFIPTFGVLGFSISSFVLVFVILVGGLIAYFASLIFGSCILPPVYRWRERINGAPFETGDVVEILKKPHRGRTARMVSPGNPQYGACVRLSDSGDGSATLNVEWHAIRRLSKAEQDIGANGEKSPLLAQLDHSPKQ